MGNAQEQKILFVTSNSKKFSEYRNMLDLSCITWAPLKIPQPDEIAIINMAESKIKYARKKVHQFPFCVEQNGLEIPAWNGLPGGLSKIFIDTVGDDNICRMLKHFKGHERSARIQTVIYIIQGAKGEPKRFGWSLDGSISTKPRGSEGFGWDRLFVPKGYEETFAELGLKKKLEIISQKNEEVLRFKDFLLSCLNQPEQGNITVTPVDTEIESLKKQLNRRKENLYYLEEQAAKYSSVQVPVDLHNQMEEEKKAIEELKVRMLSIAL